MHLLPRRNIRLLISASLCALFTLAGCTEESVQDRSNAQTDEDESKTPSDPSSDESPSDSPETDDEEQVDEGAAPAGEARDAGAGETPRDRNDDEAPSSLDGGADEPAAPEGEDDDADEGAGSDAENSDADGGDEAPEAEDAGVTDGGATPGWAMREDLGKGDGSDVVTIGDSWMTMYSGGIEGALRRAGGRYRNYGVAATTLLSGQIPGQYDRAKRANANIKTVIMTGGGNDVMFSGACRTAESCAEFSMRLGAALNTLWTKMADDGVQDVIYVQYSSSAGSTPEDRRTAGGGPSVPICTSGRINCHSIPTSDIVTSRDIPDGIHPNRAGHDRIAKRLLETMEQRKIRR